MSNPADRLIVRTPSGAWAVRPPTSHTGTLWALTRAEAVQWAWNITQDTGGRVLLYGRDEDLR
jgi:hypothetical protein